VPGPVVGAGIVGDQPKDVAPGIAGPGPAAGLHRQVEEGVLKWAERRHRIGDELVGRSLSSTETAGGGSFVIIG